MSIKLMPYVFQDGGDFYLEESAPESIRRALRVSGTIVNHSSGLIASLRFASDSDIADARDKRRTFAAMFPLLVESF